MTSYCLWGSSGHARVLSSIVSDIVDGLVTPDNNSAATAMPGIPRHIGGSTICDPIDNLAHVVVSDLIRAEPSVDPLASVDGRAKVGQGCHVASGGGISAHAAVIGTPLSLRGVGSHHSDRIGLGGVTMFERPQAEHQRSVMENVRAIAQDRELTRLTTEWFNRSAAHHYSYNFEWLGRPIIQYPQDIVCLQELIWKIKPNLIVETGIAHGGSLILSASMLALLDLCDAIANETPLETHASNRHVIGIDIEIRPHNRSAIDAHPLSRYITMIEASSTEPTTIQQVHDLAHGRGATLVCLDSNHTHEHVLAELSAYASLVTPNSYCVVFDTMVEDMGPDMYPDRPWGPGNNPKTAVWKFLESHSEFEIDRDIQHKLQITVAPDGFLRRVR